MGDELCRALTAKIKQFMSDAMEKGKPAEGFRERHDVAKMRGQETDLCSSSLKG